MASNVVHRFGRWVFWYGFRVFLVEKGLIFRTEGAYQLNERFFGMLFNRSTNLNSSVFCSFRNMSAESRGISQIALLFIKCDGLLECRDRFRP